MKKDTSKKEPMTLGTRVYLATMGGCCISAGLVISIGFFTGQGVWGETFHPILELLFGGVMPILIGLWLSFSVAYKS